MRQDVESYVQTCQSCQIGRDKTIKAKSPMNLWPAKRFNEVLHIDVWGPYPRSRRGNEYIIGLKDRFSRYIVLEPSPNQLATTVARIIKEKWIVLFGAPERLMSDCGANLVSKVVRALLVKHGIKPSTTTPYYPEGNGSMERVFRYMAGSLRIMNVEEFGSGAKHSKTWDLQCKDVQSIYNRTKSRAIGVAPASLVTPSMKFQMTVWGDITEAKEFITEQERIRRYEEELKSFTATQLKIAQEKQRWYDHQRKVYFDKGKTGKGITVGCEVLRYEAVRRKKQNKLQPYFSGPWKVIGKEKTRVDIEMDNKDGGKEFARINEKWLKLYHRRQPNSGEFGTGWKSKGSW